MVESRRSLGSITRPHAVRLYALCLLSSVLILKAQTPQASAPASPDTDPAAQSDPAAAFQITAKVQRVILDVVVTDAKGRPVEGLNRDDFKVLEDGVVQPVRNFDVHVAAPGSSAQRPLDLHLPANTFSNLTVASPDKPVTVLLYDVLNTPQSALPFAHQALVKFIKDQQSSTQIAVFVLTDRLHMLQGFTDDETRLMAAVDSKSIKSRVSQLRTADTTADTAALLAADPAAAAQTQQQQVTAGSAATGADAILAQLNNVEAEEASYLLKERVEITVNAFANIARFLSAIPGRKNLIWMSGAFPTGIFPDSTQVTGGRGEFDNTLFLQDDVRQAQDVLKESRVAIYPVDVRGLQADPQFSAASRSAVPVAGFGVQQGAEHATMDAIADNTGGRAFYNTNGLKDAMDDVIRQSSAYYSLTYAPTNTKANGAERRVKVEVAKPGYHLYYRRQYLADDGSPSTTTPFMLDMNMQHGAPSSSELFFETKVVPVGPPMKASANEIETLKTFLQTNAKGKRTKIAEGPQTVQHYDVSFLILGRLLDMPQTEKGNYLTDMDFGLAAYTDNSELLNGMEVSIRNMIPAAQYQKIESEGYHASMIFVVPQEAVSVRVAVRDKIGNRIGTLEIPLPLSPATGSSAKIR